MTAATGPGAGRARAAAADLLDGLNPEQRQAAEAVCGPVRILAGAGTGKTRTITHRIAQQVASGAARPDQILAVTFTERAAAELRDRLHALGLDRPVRAATFHAAAWAQLRWFWDTVMASPLPEVLSSKVPLLARLAGRDAEPRDLAAEIEWAKARALDPDGYAEVVATREPPVTPEAMVTLYRRYEQAKTEAHLIDYEDMLLHMAGFMDEPSVAAEVRGRYRYFTVDEFQDVNPAQWRLLRAWLGTGEELCVVGDPDQTIYSFTGADARYLTDFSRHFPHARDVALSRNYRSSPEILDVANRLLSRPPHRSPPRLSATAPSGPTPELREFADADAEAAAVAERVAALAADGVAPAEIAICYRTNAQSETYEERLRRAGIPYVLRGAQGFFDRRAVRRARTALVRASHDPPERHGGPPPPGTTPAKPPDPLAVAERVLRAALSWRPDAPPSGAARRAEWEDVGEVVALLGRLRGERPGAEFAELVELLEARAAAAGGTSGPATGVTLQSLHKAKGCEFDAVFLVAVEEGLLPISYARADAAAIAEERRLLYVGATRARRHLWISWARSRPGWQGRTQKRKPSRFLDGLRPAPERRPRTASTGGAAREAAAADPALVARLRDWRLERSKADGVPAYVVFPDTTLHELAEVKPSSTRELRAVSGFGPTRTQRYGADVLAVLHDAG